MAAKETSQLLTKLFYDKKKTQVRESNLLDHTAGLSAADFACQRADVLSKLAKPLVEPLNTHVFDTGLSSVLRNTLNREKEKKQHDIVLKMLSAKL